MYCRDEFPEAVKWTTKVRNGRVDIYKDDKPLLPQGANGANKKNPNYLIQ